jgi:hypothetical protein
VSKRTKWLLSIGVIAALVVGWQVVAYGVVAQSSFQDDDGDLDPALPASHPANTIDWNSFDPITWTGSAPNRLADQTNAGGTGWHFVGKEDGRPGHHF